MATKGKTENQDPKTEGKSESSAKKTSAQKKPVQSKKHDGNVDANIFVLTIFP